MRTKSAAGASKSDAPLPRRATPRLTYSEQLWLCELLELWARL